MSTEFIRSFKFLTLFVALAMGTSIGHSCAVENLNQYPNPLKRKASVLVDRDIRDYFPQVAAAPRLPREISESEVRSFDWGTRNETGNTVISDLNGKSVATIYTLRRGTDAGKFGIFFNESPHTRISQNPFGNILDAKRWVIKAADNNGISLRKR